MHTLIQLTLTAQLVARRSLFLVIGGSRDRVSMTPVVLFGGRRRLVTSLTILQPDMHLEHCHRMVEGGEV